MHRYTILLATLVSTLVTPLTTTAQEAPGISGVPDRFRTRLFFTPTATTLPTGAKQFALYEGVIPVVSVGLNHWVTVSAVIPTVIEPGKYEGLLCEPKIHLPIELPIQVSLGALAGFSKREISASYYLVLTRGEPDASFSFGILYDPSARGREKLNTFFFGVEYRLLQWLKFVNDNLFLHGEAPMPMFGFRAFLKNYAIDLGIGVPHQKCGLGPGAAFPVVNLMVVL